MNRSTHLLLVVAFALLISYASGDRNLAGTMTSTTNTNLYGGSVGAGNNADSDQAATTQAATTSAHGTPESNGFGGASSAASSGFGSSVTAPPSNNLEVNSQTGGYGDDANGSYDSYSASVQAQAGAALSQQMQQADQTQPQTSFPAFFNPPSLMSIFAVDFHFVAGYGLGSSYIAYHYCSGAPNITQCSIFNGIGSSSKLIAVEMIVGAAQFMAFSEEEKALWHSHDFGILSGLFVLPFASPADELKVISTLLGTYGKVTDFYHPASNDPLGVPQLAYAWTSESQVNTELVEIMEEVLNLTTTRQQRMEARKNLMPPADVPGHDEYRETGFIKAYEIGSIAVNETNGVPF